MKKTLSMITLAVLTIGLLGSCSKINERLDNLEKKVDGLENEKIASIENQITGINSSIADLGTIRSNIQSLTDGAKSQGEDITDLQAADKALGERINDLNKYVNDTLKATKEWVKATFSTLEQYEKTCDTIAKIDARIGDLDANLSKKITDCVDSLKKWVNVQFEAYYTAAQMDAKLAKMKVELDSAKGRGIIVDSKSDSLAAELTKTKADIDTAKAHITREYTEAIKSAIEVSEGNLTKALQDSIATVNETVTALTDRVVNLETEVISLTGRVTELEKIVQSITFIPEYEGGAAIVRLPVGKNEFGDLILNYEVSGYNTDKTSIAKQIENAFKANPKVLSLDYKKTKANPTKAAYNGTLKIKRVRENGFGKNILSVVVDAESLNSDDVKSLLNSFGFNLAVRLRLHTGKTDILSDYTDLKLYVENLQELANNLPYYLNYIYGSEEWFILTELGTDEATWATGATEQMKLIDQNMGAIPADAWPLEKLWNVAYSAINLSNLIIAQGTAQSIKLPVIAEAYFYRAFWYFNLVRIFDGVPYVTTYDENIFYKLRERKTSFEILENIIRDLEQAKNSLENTARINGGPTRHAALLLEAQAALTYGQMKRNSIPTYPVASEGSSLGSMTADEAIALASKCTGEIISSGMITLQPTFYDAYTNPEKDYNNQEWIIYADHRKDDVAAMLPNYGVELGSPYNVTGQLMNWNWDKLKLNGTQVMYREDGTRYGFPRNLFASIPVAPKFPDTDLDSRWDATFNTQFKGNWRSFGPENITIDDLTFFTGRDIIQILSEVDYDVTYGTSFNVPMVGKDIGMYPDKYVLDISHCQRDCYPTLAKYNSTVGDNSRYSLRPSLALSYGEVYMVYAEAQVMLGRLTDADKDKSINLVRRRAGNWTYKYNEGSTVEESHGDELADKTGSTVDINYILDERFREFYGSGLRWFDLKRTATIEECCSVYFIYPSGTVTEGYENKRNGSNRFALYIRPIPQAQVNRTHIQQSIIK